MLNEVGEWAMVIENEVWTTEHSDQLDRYHWSVKKTHPGWQIFGVYLTPFGDAPSHEKYLRLGYGAVCEIVEDVLGDQGLSLSSDLRMSL